MLLVCNAPDAVAQVLGNWKPTVDPECCKRIESLIPLDESPGWDALQVMPKYMAAQKTIARLTV
jgi:beta-N-acetylhexosaminidase